MYRPKTTVKMMMSKIRANAIIYDSDFDGLSLKEAFQIIDAMSIEQLMLIKKDKIKAYLTDYSSYSDHKEYYDLNEKKGALYDEEEED